MRGVRLMISQACAGLLLRPGLGKTTTAYAAVKILKDKKLARKTLVVAPLRVAYNVWPEQKNDWEEFKDLKVQILHGSDKEFALKQDADIYVINPEGLEWLFEPTYEVKVDSKGVALTNKKKVLKINAKRIEEFDVLLVDESTKFKAHNSNRFKLIQFALKYFKRRYILTGTIAPNGLLDIWAQIYILDQGASLGRFITHYREKWFHQGGYGGYDWYPDQKASKEIAEKIAPLTIQIDHKDYLEMPEILPPNDIFIELPTKVMDQYKTMEKKLVAEILSGKIVAKNGAVSSGKCRQIANGALYLEDGVHYEVLHEEKLKALEDLIEELSGEPVLIAYQFQFDREMIAKRLKIPTIGRGDAAKDREVIKAFSRGELPAVMGHPESISLGLDGLQDSCHNVCWYGVPWNLLHYVQTLDRIWRPGSRSKTVSIHRILAKDTIDQDVVETIEGKETEQDLFLAIVGKLTERNAS